MDNDNVPGFTADPKLQAKIDALDEPAPKDEEVKEEVKDEPAEPKEEPKEDKKDEAAEEENKSNEEPAEDEGYTIDEEADEDEEEPAPTSTDKAQQQGQLTAEQQYIIDNLQPIEVSGYVGSSDKLQTFKVFAPEQLPSGFKFADEREMAVATKNFGMLESKAQQLQNDYRNQETEKATKEFKAREDAADRQDLAKLQKDGLIPKFKAKPDSPDFEKDAGVQLAQEILDFKDKKNQEYLDAYNAGRPYRHIGVEEAYYMFKRENPDKTNEAQRKEDQERKEIAKRTSNTKGTAGEKQPSKVGAHSGMSSMELERLIENKTADW